MAPSDGDAGKTQRSPGDDQGRAEAARLFFVAIFAQGLVLALENTVYLGAPG